MKARRVQNFVKTQNPNNEPLVKITEGEENTMTLPPRQKAADKPANMQKSDIEIEENSGEV